MFNKTIFTVGLAILCLLGLGHLYYALTGDFHAGDLLARLTVTDDNVQDRLSQEDQGQIERLLRQPFRYLGHGHQTYAFVSQDGKYVLKLFKKDYLARTWMVHVVPPIGPFRSLFWHQGASKEARTAKLLKGYRDAFLHARENSGLLYFRAGVGSVGPQDIVLVDGLGFQQVLPLQDYVFAVQVKAVIARKELSRLLSTGDVEAAKERVRQLFDLYRSDYRNGVYDNDHNLLDNAGFIKDRAVRLDVGKVVWDPENIDDAFIRQDLEKIVYERMHPWFKRRFPKYSSSLLQEMEKVLL